MEFFLAALSFLNGIALGAGGVYVIMRKPRPINAEVSEEADRMARQFDNFMNYDGTERGQRPIGR